MPEYWIVNPLTESITVLRLQGNSYEETGVYRRGQSATSVVRPDFQSRWPNSLISPRRRRMRRGFGNCLRRILRWPSWRWDTGLADTSLPVSGKVRFPSS